MDRPTTRAEAQAYLDAVNSGEASTWPQPCEYGHFGCATSLYGPCSDELAGEFQLDDDDDN